MEEMSTVIALAISVGNPLQDRKPVEINRVKLMTDASSMLSDPMESDAEAVIVEGGGGGDDLEVRTLPGSDEEDSISAGPEQSPESSSLVIIDGSGIATALEEFSALDAADTTAIVVSLDMVKRISPGVKITAGDSGTEGVTDSDLKAAAAALVDPAAQGSRAFLRNYVPLWGCMSICGGRAEMEDAAVALPWFWEIPAQMLAADCLVESRSPSLSRLPAHFFGVYDGHGGAQVANYCRERIHLALIEEIRNLMRSFEDNSGDDWKKRWVMAFTNCFVKVDDEVGGKASREVVGRTLDASEEGSSSSLSSFVPSEAIAPETVGSTAVVAVICSSHIIIANCGDSRAVLCRGKVPIALSVDHKPNRDDERARIEAAGGKVIQWNGYRVLGVLAMSRSIGMYALPKQAKVESGKIRTENACIVLVSLANICLLNALDIHIHLAQRYET